MSNQSKKQSSPIPQEWLIKYKFEVMVALTYSDKDIEVEVPLSDKEIAKIKKLVAASIKKEDEPEDEEEFVQEESLLMILEEKAPKLFDKFWKVIMPRVFVESLIDAFENGYIEEKHEDDNYVNYRKANFDKLYAMYGDEMELEHSSCCICKIPKEWLP